MDHVSDMFDEAVQTKGLASKTVLIDIWYAARELMLHIAELGKIYYTVAKPNRLIAEHHGQHAYQRIDTLDWTEDELAQGKRIRLNDFPNKHKEQLFRVTVLPARTDFVVSNDLTQNDVMAVRDECKICWKIEEFHREIKQLTGIESCQCRKPIIQKNHIGCSMLVWTRLKNLAYQSGRNVYDLWKSQFEPMIASHFQDPTLSFA